jgi:predicted site-specific integrase-resolvase
MSVEKVTTPKAAKAAKISRMTLQEWIRKGWFRAPRTQLRDGRAARLWSSKDIDRLIAAKKRLYKQKLGRPKKDKESSKV